MNADATATTTTAAPPPPRTPVGVEMNADATTTTAATVASRSRDECWQRPNVRPIGRDVSLRDAGGQEAPADVLSCTAAVLGSDC